MSQMVAIPVTRGTIPSMIKSWASEEASASSFGGRSPLLTQRQPAIFAVLVKEMA